VRVTVEIKRDILVTQQGDRLLVDLAKQYPAVQQTIKAMTQEGTEAPQGATPETQPAPGKPGEQTPGVAPGGGGGSAPGGGGVGSSSPTPPPAPGASPSGAVEPAMTPEARGLLLLPAGLAEAELAGGVGGPVRPENRSLR
jgi:hypothetical protein